MHQVEMVDDRYMLLDTDGIHINLSYVGAVLRTLKEGNGDRYGRYSSNIVYLWTGHAWDKLPMYMTFIQGDQR